MHRILCPTNFTDNSDRALRYACELADRNHAKLLIVHVEDARPVEPGQATLQALDTGAAPIGASMAPAGPAAPQENKHHSSHPTAGERLLQAAPEQPELDYEHLLLKGDPADAILNVASQNQVDQIVMGASGRSGVGQLIMGSTSESVAQNAPCPVTLVGDEGVREDAAR